jgi:hypothetical protein
MQQLLTSYAVQLSGCGSVTSGGGFMALTVCGVLLLNQAGVSVQSCRAAKFASHSMRDRGIAITH